MNVVEEVSAFAEHGGLERQHQRRQPQNQGTHEAEGIHGVKDRSPHRTGVL
jgi:hypothetical protein